MTTFLLAVAACSGSKDPETTPRPVAPGTAPPPATATTTKASAPTPIPSRSGSLPQGLVSYRCDGGSQVQVTYGAASAAVRWNGRIYNLREDPSVSDGVLFRNSSYQWRVDGKTGTLIERGRTVAKDCSAG